MPKTRRSFVKPDDDDLESESKKLKQDDDESESSDSETSSSESDSTSSESDCKSEKSTLDSSSKKCLHDDDFEPRESYGGTCNRCQSRIFRGNEEMICKTCDEKICPTCYFNDSASSKNAATRHKKATAQVRTKSLRNPSKRAQTSSSSASTTSKKLATPSKPRVAFMSPLKTLAAKATSTKSQAISKPTFKNSSHRALVKELKHDMSNFFTTSLHADGNKKFARPIRFELRRADHATSYPRVLIYGNYPLKETFTVRGSLVMPPKSHKYEEGDCHLNESHVEVPLQTEADKVDVLLVLIAIAASSLHLVICQENLVQYLEGNEVTVQTDSWTLPDIRDYVEDTEQTLLNAQENRAVPLQKYIRFRSAVAKYAMCVAYQTDGSDFTARKLHCNDLAKDFFDSISLKEISVPGYNNSDILPGIAPRDFYFACGDGIIPNQQQS